PGGKDFYTMATIEEPSLATDTGHYKQVGQGQNVVEHEPVEGPSLWLETPDDVIEFVMGDNVTDTIVISRGGATTFVAPALTAGVKGLITLQGGRESHLGIVSREFGIPCVMSVAFTEGITTSEGETVPANGTILRLDTSAMPMADVYVKGE
ncbi:MAG TPA: PEP-utilizing enzyme, partial [Acidimicrobiia bacterium]|nr:PEP-utilizing enzyme [Acidimicrobiia bacterium]